ncbi:MAG: EscS/YscS/HrcS family type III secretion system export apparatus protein [Deltaproteobacteria bacterium RIFOXYA12_FULL_58_15]|nr:MAG: EscS/YscS/HrcS family type III secretion system export apparatus protein [Deltaproteobacteria bacterium RIFOXYA12_FULL_58_15]OGR09263.1 MAG: EscS/YscS/HrcS family type III secretion system export apparatus protein [Deltaproteobacteria bacterium RIFOXYB12_FULL_58_9]
MDQRAIEFILRITSEGLLMIVVVCGPPILLSMIVGLSVSLFQAVTQIQEATLTFVPKMLIIFATLAALGPWLGAALLRFTAMCFTEFPKLLY